MVGKFRTEHIKQTPRLPVLPDPRSLVQSPNTASKSASKLRASKNKRSQARIPLITILTTRAKAWARLIKNEVSKELTIAETIFNTRVMAKWVEYAVSDSGATGYFLIE